MNCRFSACVKSHYLSSIGLNNDYLVPLMTYSTSYIGVTLKCGLEGRSKSLKMARIDRSYDLLLVFHCIVGLNIALSCTILELHNVQNIVTLKARLLEMAPFDRSHYYTVCQIVNNFKL